MACRRNYTNVDEKLMRKGDQQSELGSLAAAAGDIKAAEEYFEKARYYWRQAREKLVEGHLKLGD